MSKSSTLIKILSLFLILCLCLDSGIVQTAKSLHQSPSVDPFTFWNTEALSLAALTGNRPLVDDPEDPLALAKKIASPQPSWVQQHVPDMEGKSIVEVTMEMALSNELLKQLASSLKQARKPLSEENQKEIMRACAMNTSTGGIGPLLKERVIAQASLGADVIGVSLLYDYVWVQKTVPITDMDRQQDSRIELEKVEVGHYLRAILEDAGTISLEMNDGSMVDAKVWKAPAGSYGEGTVYFLDAPSITSTVYPGGKDHPGTSQAVRNAQSWLLGRGTLALLKRENKKPNIVVMSEVPSMFVHHRMFRDQFSDDPFFNDTAYVFNDHTPLDYAHPFWDDATLKALRVDERYYRNILSIHTITKSGVSVVDGTAMMINAADAVYAVAQKHADVMRAMPLLVQFGDKIDFITNGVSPTYWPQETFQNAEQVAQTSDDELRQIKTESRNKLFHWIAERQGLGQKWADEMIKGSHPIGVWCRRIVEYKRLERFAEILEDPVKRERFLQTGIVFIFGGRIHQDDPYGLHQYNRVQKVLHEDPRLKERVIFFDNYNIWEAPHLFQGADFSVMLADDGREASATGFQKAQMNGALIIASHDGAVPESVVFYNPLGMNQKANGFNVPYNGEGMPTAEGLLVAFEQFHTVYSEPEVAARMIRNGLNQTPWLSVNRTAQEMVGFFADTLKKKHSRDLRFAQLRRITPGERSHLLAYTAIRLLQELGQRAGFEWRYKPKGPLDDKTNLIHMSAPGLLGFLDGLDYVHSMGTVGDWSLFFHTADDVGHLITYILEQLKSHLSSDPFPQYSPLKPLHDEIELLAAEARTSAEKLLLNLLAVQKLSVFVESLKSIIETHQSAEKEREAAA